MSGNQTLGLGVVWGVAGVLAATFWSPWGAIPCAVLFGFNVARSSALYALEALPPVEVFKQSVFPSGASVTTVTDAETWATSSVDEHGELLNNEISHDEKAALRAHKAGEARVG